MNNGNVISINKPNLFAQSVRKGFKKEVAFAAAEHCRTHFSIFHVLQYIMYTEAVLAFDIIEERGLMRNSIVRYRNIFEKEWNRYQNTMRRMLPQREWCLMQDFCMAAHNNIYNQTNMLYLCASNYLLKLRCKNVEILARLAVALTVVAALRELWVQYFATYKRACGLDFTQDFRYADLRTAYHYLQLITDLVNKGNPDVSFQDDANCANAIVILTTKLVDDDFQDEAARVAISYNEEVAREYQAELQKAQ